MPLPHTSTTIVNDFLAVGRVFTGFSVFNVFRRNLLLLLIIIVMIIIIIIINDNN